GIPYLTTGAATELERVYDINGTSIQKIKHTIEPFVTYAYAPRIYQGNLPLFDQYDRMNSRSLITYGVTTRLFAKGSPQPTEEVQPMETQPAEVAPTVGPLDSLSSPTEVFAPTPGTTESRGQTVRELAQLTLMPAYDISHEIAHDGGHASDFQGRFTLFPTTIAALGSQLDYNPRQHAGITFASVYANIQPPWSRISNVYMGKALQGSFIQLSYNYVNPETAVLPTTTGNASQFGMIRAYTDLFDRFGLYIAPSYDFAADRLLSAQYGVRLKSPCDCWSTDVGVSDTFNPNEVAVMLQVTLGGLGSIG